MARRTNRYSGRAQAKAPGSSGWRTLFKRLFQVLLAVAVFTGLGLGLISGYRWATWSPVFSLEKVHVKGNHRLSERHILDIAGVRKGVNIFSLNMGAIDERLRQEQWIDEVVVRRVLPNGLTLQIHEREPCFWRQRGDRILYADKKGQFIAPVSTGRFVSLPLLVYNSTSSYEQSQLMAIRRWLTRKQAPFSLGEVAWLRFVSEEIIEVALQDRDLTMRFGTEHLKLNCSRLVTIWRDLAARGEMERMERIMVYEGAGWVKERRGS
jgi:cell division protein FtsQ